MTNKEESIQANYQRRSYSEESLRAIYECALDGIVVIDSKGLIEAFNPAAEKLFGYSLKSVLGQNIKMLMPEPFKKAHDGYLSNYMETGVARIIGIGREVIGLRSDGSVFPMELAISEMHVGKERKFTGLVRDITERKKYLEELEAAHEAEKRLQLLIDSIQDYAIFTLNADGLVTSWNAGAEQVSGYASVEAMGNQVSSFYTMEDRTTKAAEKMLEEAAQTGSAKTEGWRVRKNGTRYWASAVITALYDAQHNVTAYINVSRDLTERKKSEAELRDREVRIRTLVQTTADGIIVFNAQGRIESFNPSAEGLFGYSSAEIRNRDVRLLAKIEQSSKPKFNVQAVVAELKGENIGQRKDGTLFPIDISLSEMKLGNDVYFTAVVRDITARKQAEEQMQSLNASLEAQVVETQAALMRLSETQSQLVQSEKLASLGGMAAGIAHEINTPLGIGVTASSTLKYKVDNLRKLNAEKTLTPAEIEDYLVSINKASDLTLGNLERAATLVHSFKEVSTDQSGEERRRINLKAYIDDILVSLAPRLNKSHHTIKVECPTDLFTETYPGAVAQILTNFIMNSLVHAYPDGRQGTINIQVSARKDGISLIYKDDGIGIGSELVSRVFEPFFTTKRGSGGSGLGLYITYNLVTQQLGGTIKILSEPQQGVELQLTLPLSAPVRPPKLKSQ